MYVRITIVVEEYSFLFCLAFPENVQNSRLLFYDVKIGWSPPTLSSWLNCKQHNHLGSIHLVEKNIVFLVQDLYNIWFNSLCI